MNTLNQAHLPDPIWHLLMVNEAGWPFQENPIYHGQFS